MSQYQTLSRRRFIGLSFAALATSPAIFKFSDAVAEGSLLTFRQNAPLLKLHFNENSMGMSPKALMAAQRAVAELGNRYADKELDDFQLLLSAKHKVSPEQILFGNGSTEILSGVVRLAAQQGATVVEPTPTFGAVRRYAKAENMKVVQVPVGSDFVTDIEALRSAADAQKDAVLVNLCNPNNPTGTIADFAQISDWITSAPDNHIFLLDEAYHDYALANPCYKTGLDLIHKGKENLIIARTFSKIHGMAGMRVGYGIAAPKTAGKLKPFTADFNLSAAGIAAATAAMQDEAFYQASLASNQKAKSILIKTLDDLKLPHMDSNTNFVLHRINANLSEYSTRMKANGIWVGRRMTKDVGWNRLSIGTPEEMSQFTKALRAFRERGWV